VGKLEYTRSMRCRNCDVDMSMRIISQRGESSNQSQQEYTGLFWELIECPVCTAVMLRQGYSDEFLNFGGADDYQLLQPAEDEYVSGLPSSIATAYAVALQVKTINSSVYCALLMRLLKLVCSDQNVTTETPLAAIGELAARGILSKRLAELAGEFHRSRDLESDADPELGRADVPVLESLVKAVLAYVYVAPAMVETVQLMMDKEAAPNGAAQ